jgi:hypothetical protein
MYGKDDPALTGSHKFRKLLVISQLRLNATTPSVLLLCLKHKPTGRLHFPNVASTAATISDPNHCLLFCLPFMKGYFSG